MTVALTIAPCVEHLATGSQNVAARLLLRSDLDQPFGGLTRQGIVGPIRSVELRDGIDRPRQRSLPCCRAQLDQGNVVPRDDDYNGVADQPAAARMLFAHHRNSRFSPVYWRRAATAARGGVC